MMDERAVFEEFHEALNVEPRDGAYDRFRIAFITPPAAANQRPVFRLRFTKMSLRLVAVAAAVAVAIALVAGYLATHQHPPSSTLPAKDANVKAYSVLMETDYIGMQNATSNHCGTIQDQGCAQAIGRVNPALQKWIDDLAAFQTPPRYAVLDAQMRAHLSAAIFELNAAIRFQSQHDESGFNLASGAALYERGWLDPATGVLEGDNQSDANSYAEAVVVAKLAVDACAKPSGSGCSNLLQPEPCLGAASQSCASDLEGAESQLEIAFVALVHFAAPQSRSSQDAAFQADLAKADSALLAITEAQLRGDAAGVSSTEAAYEAAIRAAGHDIDALASA